MLHPVLREVRLICVACVKAGQKDAGFVTRLTVERIEKFQEGGRRRPNSHYTLRQTCPQCHELTKCWLDEVLP